MASKKTETKKKTNTKTTKTSKPKRTRKKDILTEFEKELEEDIKQEVKTQPIALETEPIEINEAIKSYIEEPTPVHEIIETEPIEVERPIETNIEVPVQEETIVTEPRRIITETNIEDSPTDTYEEEQPKKVVKTVYRLKKVHGLHIGFNTRLLLNIVLIIVLLVASIKTATMAFEVSKNEVIKYKENSTIDYRVYLKENDFYEKEYLDKGMAYVASLIDKIKIKYNYFFTVDKNSDIDIENKVVAKLIITSQNNSNIFFEKEYELAENTSEELKNGKNYALKKEVEIDYGYYNNLANKFRSNYAVNTNSILEVYLQVKEKNKDTNTFDLSNENKTVLTIPLSEQEININIDNKNINDEKQIVKEREVKITKPIYLIISGVIILLILIEIIRLIKKLLLLKNKSNKYDKYIKKILRGYDRVIVNVKTAPNLDDYNVIKVESFEELIDVRDNIKEPIKYLVIQEHQKSEFFITNHIDLYLYVVKEVDLNGEKDEKKKVK